MAGSHKEYLKRKSKEWREKNKEKSKKYFHDRYERLKDTPEFKKKIRESQKRYYLSHKKEILEKGRKWKQHKREMIKEKLGTTCIICGKKPNRISYHEIHGKPHDSKSITYILKHLEDFVPLCGRCHIAIHFYANFHLKEKEYQEEIKKFARLIYKEPS